MFRHEAGVAPPPSPPLDQLYSTRRVFLTLGDRNKNELPSDTNPATLDGAAESCIAADAPLENRRFDAYCVMDLGKFNVYKTFVISILLHGWETWTLMADSNKKDPSFAVQVPEKTFHHSLFGAQGPQLGS